MIIPIDRKIDKSRSPENCGNAAVNAGPPILEKLVRSSENGVNGRGPSDPGPESASVHLERFLAFAFDPAAGCMEFAARGSEISKTTNRIERTGRYPATHGGWFNDPARIGDAVRRLGTVSAEVTINPIRAEFAERTNGNAVGKIAKGDEAKARDVVCLRYLLIAVEFERVSGTGATAQELEATVQVRDEILKAHPEIRESAIWGCSGNGSYIMLKINKLTNEKRNGLLLQRMLQSLAEEFGKKDRDRVYIDAGLGIPDARMGLPGTKRCEGKESRVRPFRLITVDGGGSPFDGLDLPEFVRTGQPIQVVRAAVEPVDGYREAAQDGSSRPTILITTEEHDVNDQAIEALAADPTVYQRGFMLVTVQRDCKPEQGIVRPAGSSQIVQLPLAILRERLARCARWIKKRKSRSGGMEEVPAHPPDWAVSAVSARGEWPLIRPLEGVVEAPTLRQDGTILDIPGYDVATGLLYEPNADYPPIKAEPTLIDAQEAAAVLLDLLVDFPFAKPDESEGGGCSPEAHKAAWLVALLTVQARFAIDGPCPLFLFDSSSPAAGKGMLCDLISVIATGRDAPRKDYPYDNEEMRKVITAVALAGDRLMLLDNIACSFGGSALDGALTARTWKDRHLGLSKMTPDMPLYAVWFGTGNNVSLKGDAKRRIVPCRLEPMEERPEERTGFKYPKLLEHVARERPALVVAGLTILRAYKLAGSPDQQLPPLGSFEAWSDVARSAVYWTLRVDPCDTRINLHANDDHLDSVGAVIEGWSELPGGDCAWPR